MESAEWNNGVFMYTLREAFKSDGDTFAFLKYPDPNTLFTYPPTPSTLRLFLTTKIRALTGGQQSPDLQSPNDDEDFDLNLIKRSKGASNNTGSHAPAQSGTPSSDQELLNTYVQARQNGDMAAFLSFFADRVNYQYGNGMVAKDFIRKDVSALQKRWNQRIVCTPVNINRTSSDTIEVTYSYDYTSTKGKHASGTTTETWTIDAQGKICGWKGKIHH